MTPCLRNAIAFFLLSLFADGTQCEDADCEFHAQLLQQDVNMINDVSFGGWAPNGGYVPDLGQQATLALPQFNGLLSEGRAKGEVRLADRMGTSSKDVAKKTREHGTADLNVSTLTEQAATALAQFNEMISEGRAEGEIRLTDRMGASSKDVTEKNHENGTVDLNVSKLAEHATIALNQFNEMLSEGRAEGEVRLADRMGASSKDTAKKTQEYATVGSKVSRWMQQATVAFSQFNEMLSEGRAKGEVRLADRMGLSSKNVAKKIQVRADPEVVAYSSKTGCGIFDLDKNNEWCRWSRQKFHVKKTFNCIDHVFTDACAGGIAKFISVEGDDTADSVRMVDGCSYRFYAKYECLEVIIADLDAESNYTYLRQLEKNLTDMIHEQAIVVSKTTDKYFAAQAAEASTDAASDVLEDNLDTAETKENVYDKAHTYHAYALYQKKQELDALQNATDEANETLQIVKPKYLAAEAAYQAALGPQPYVEENAEDASKEAEEAQAALAAADQAQAAADLAVENTTMRLQKEIKKLNDKNNELRSVQEDLDRPLPDID